MVPPVLSIMIVVKCRLAAVPYLKLAMHDRINTDWRFVCQDNLTIQYNNLLAQFPM